MIKLKKIFSVLLCVAMLVGVVPVIAAEETQEVVYGKNAYGLLNALGIAEYTEESLIEGITRGEFYKMIALTGRYDKAELAEGRFSDVASDNEYAGYIAAVANAGLIAPTKLGKIYPNGNITAFEAASILAKVLGYSQMAEGKGGYPVGYRQVIKKLELFNDIPKAEDTVINKGMAAQLVYNALNAQIWETTYGGITVEGNGGILVYEMFKVARVEGIVNAVDLTRLIGLNDTNPFHIEIDGLQLESRAIPDVYSFLGYNVIGYYRVDKDLAYDKLIYLQKTDRNEETVIDIETVSKATPSSVEYTPEGANRVKKTSFKTGTPVIYNGTATSAGFNSSMLTGKLGKVKLLDNNGDSSADVIFVEAYRNLVPSHIDGTNFVLYNLYDKNDKLTLDTTANDPYSIIFDSAGEECKLSDINSEMVLSVYESAADAYQGYIRAYINEASVVGVIKSTRKNKSEIIIGEDVFKVNDGCVSNDGALLTPGSSVELLFDIAGKVARVKLAPTDTLKFGYIMGLTMEQKTFEKELLIKLFNKDGEVVTVKAAKNIKLDGVSKKFDDADVLTTLNKASKIMFGDTTPADSYSSMVRYSLNKNGDIAVVDTVINSVTGEAAVREDEETENDALFVVSTTGDTSNEAYLGNRYRIGSQIATSATTEVMFYPSPVATPTKMMDEDMYLMSTAKAMMANNKFYNVNAFYTDSKSVVSEFVGVIYSDDIYSSLDETNNFGVIKEIAKGMDSEGNITDILTVIHAGNMLDITVKQGVTISVSDEAVARDLSGGLQSVMQPSDLRMGDVIRYNTDYKGEISYIAMLYRADGKINVANYSSSATFRANYTFKRGYVHSVYEDGYYVYFTDSTDKNVMKDIKTSDCSLVMKNTGSPAYYRYVKGSGSVNTYVEPSSSRSLKGYRETGVDCSEIIIQQSYGTPLAIMILE